MKALCKERIAMNRRDLIGSLGLATTGLFAFNFDSTIAAEPRRDEDDLLFSSFSECADACSDCAKLCNACFDHCTTMLQAGQKGYSLTMRTCIDCAEVTRVCAALCSRESRLAKVLTEACARFCDRAASECEKFKKDKHMAECAEQCRRCAASCRGLHDDMLIA
ncbi:MAG: hypothetical protein ACI8P0_005529 [Planctomycetaceae bacterium]